MNYTVQILSLDQITLHDKLQPRAVIDEDVIQAYSDDMSNGDVFKEVDVFFDGETYWLADGYHRYHAYSRIGQSNISCNVYVGSFNDARKYALKANKSHGTRRNKTDIKRALELALELWIETNRTESKLLPAQVELSDLVGCSKQYVSKMWNELLETVPKSTSGLWNTSEKKEDALNLIENNPEMSIREIAKLSGLGVATIKRLKDEYLAKLELEKENEQLKKENEQLKNKKDIESQQQTIFDLQKQIDDNKLLVTKAKKSKLLAKKKQEYLLKNIDKIAEQKAKEIADKELEIKRQQWEKYEENVSKYILRNAEVRAKELLTEEEAKFAEQLAKKEQLIKEREDTIKELKEQASSTDNEKLAALQEEKKSLQTQLKEFKDKKQKGADSVNKVLSEVKEKKKQIDERTKTLTDLQNQLKVNHDFNNDLNSFCQILDNSSISILNIYRRLSTVKLEQLLQMEVTSQTLEKYDSTKAALVKLITDIDDLVESYKTALTGAQTGGEVNKAILETIAEVDQLYTDIDVIAKAV